VTYYRGHGEEILMAKQRVSTYTINNKVEVICGECKGMYRTVQGVECTDVTVKILKPVQVEVTFAAREI
jgi:hypothetical protein